MYCYSMDFSFDRNQKQIQNRKISWSYFLAAAIKINSQVQKTVTLSLYKRFTIFLIQNLNLLIYLYLKAENINKFCLYRFNRINLAFNASFINLFFICNLQETNFLFNSFYILVQAPQIFEYFQGWQIFFIVKNPLNAPTNKQ